MFEDIGHCEILIWMIHHIKYVITVPTLSNRIVFDYKYMNLIKKILQSFKEYKSGGGFRTHDLQLKPIARHC